MSDSRSNTLLVSALLAQAIRTPQKQLFEYVNDDGVAVAKITYGEFEARTRGLAKRLANHVPAGKCALLVYPPGIDFIIAFLACLRAGVIAVPVYPPRGARNKDLAMFLAVHGSCKAKVALTNSTYNFASRVASMKDALSALFASKTDDEGLGKWPDDLEWIVTDTMTSDIVSDVVIDKASAADVAFLQYTSGSTSLPKGVVLTHGNLAHNLATIIKALKADDTVVVVSWLPMYHDMGLIGSHLGTIYCGGSATIISPIAFVKNPPLWIDLVSSRRGTHLQAPNFAYRLTVRKFLAKQQHQPGKTFNLESVRHIFNGAEPIDPSSMDEFCEVFGKYGLRREAMVPGYGLAEHTVYVCDGGRQRLVVSRTALERQSRAELLTGSQAADAMVLVGCGAPPVDSGILIKVVDPMNSRIVEDGLVGEIWVTSPSKSEAYFGLEEKTRTDLHARLGPNPSSSDAVEVTLHAPEESKRRESSSGSFDGASASSDRSYVLATDDELGKEWLRTGDLGVWYRGELFVCGRIKDLLIVRGRNHFPQDIEATIERSDRQWIRPGCSAAFTISIEGDEHVVVCFELRQGLTDSNTITDIIAKVRASIAREHGIAPHSVAVLVEHSIPKTTSGKISRHRVKKAFLENKLKLVSRWDRTERDGADEDIVAQAEGATGPARSKPAITSMAGIELLTKLKEEAGALLERDPITMDADAPMAELGFDSMMLTQFKAAVFNALGAELADEQLFDEKCTLNKVREMIEDEATRKEQRRESPAMVGESVMTRAAVASSNANSKERRPLIAGWKKGQKCGFCGC